MAARLPELIEGLLLPAAYDHPAARIELIQTHISYVLLAGDFAYKIKKPLDLHFLDYSTLEKRRLMCETEVRLNRRLCPEAYIGVVPIVRTGARYVIGAGGEAAEYAVKMHRMPHERMMPELLARGAVAAGDVRRIARVLAAFHRDAATSSLVAAFGRVDALRTNWQENFDQTKAYVPATLSAAQRDDIRAYVERRLREDARLFDARAAGGRVRDCHGDLRSDAIVIHDDGSICIMDCIEFNERIRYGDVASDIGFLAMDLDFRERSDLADELIAAYLGEAPDETLPLVLNFYRCYRAYVRGKVDSLQSGEAEVPAGQREAARKRARAYFALAHRYATTQYPQTLVMMIGLSGSGKSYVASALAGRIGAAHVSSDAIRHAAAAGDAAPQPETPYGAGGYSDEARARVYDELQGRARQHLALGRSVILDATHIGRADRLAARRLVDDANVRFVAIEVTADEAVIRKRMEERAESGGVSDARWSVYLGQRERFEPTVEIAPDEILRLDGGASLRSNVEAALTRLESAGQ